MPRDLLKDFSKFSIILHFWRFLKNTLFLADHAVTPTLLPHNSKTIGRPSMKFGMQLHYGNASGFFQEFFEILNFLQLLPFFKNT